MCSSEMCWSVNSLMLLRVLIASNKSIILFPSFDVCLWDLWVYSVNASVRELLYTSFWHNR